MFHGLASTFYTLCNTTCQHEHSLTLLCRIHHQNTMLSSFLCTYAHAPYCHFLYNHTAQAVNHNSLGTKAIGHRLNQHAQDTAESNPSTIKLEHEGQKKKERGMREKQTKAMGWKWKGFGNQGERIACAHLIKSLCLLIVIMMSSHSLLHPHSSSLSLGGKSGITAAFQRSQSSRHRMRAARHTPRMQILHCDPHSTFLH